MLIPQVVGIDTGEKDDGHDSARIDTVIRSPIRESLFSIILIHSNDELDV